MPELVLVTWVAALLAALPTLPGCERHDRDGFVQSITKPFKSESPRDLAQMALDPRDADNRRVGITKIASAPWGGEETYVKFYRLRLEDPDETVRAVAVNALGQHGKPEDAGLIARLLTDQPKAVRWQVARALRKLHHDEAVTPLIRAVTNDEDADVRAAAADALGQYAAPGVFDALVGALVDDNFGVVHAAARSLGTLTGQDLGNDPSPWLKWSSEHRGQLFADQQPYYWRPYEKPRGMMDKLMFWKDKDAATPQQPVGVEAHSPASAESQS